MDNRIMKTKNKLYEALLKLLETTNLIEITVSMLCKEANIRRNTFYYHYDNVSDLFHELTQQFEMDAMKKMEHFKSTTELETMLLEVTQYIYDNKNIQKLLNYQPFSISFLNNITRICNQSIATRYTINPSVSYDELVKADRFSTGGVIIILLDWIHNGFVESPEYIANIMASFSKKMLEDYIE